MLARMLVLLAAIVLSTLASARTLLELDPSRQPIVLADWGDFAIDSTGKLQPTEIDSSVNLDWNAHDTSRSIRIPPGGALWIRFSVPATADTERWYLEVPSSNIEHVTLYSRDRAGRWPSMSAGSRVPVQAWPVPGRHPLLPLAISAEEPRRFLLRVANSAAFLEPVRFVSESHLNRREQRTSLALGAFLGLELLIVMLLAGKALALRDRTYVMAATALALLALSQAASTGVAPLHAWSANPLLATHAPGVLGLFTMVALTLCTLSVLSTGDRWPWLSRCIGALAALGAGLAMALPLWAPYHQSIGRAFYLTAASLALLTLILWSTRRSGGYVLYLLYGSIALAVSALPAASHSVALIPRSFWTNHALQVGTVLYGLMLLGALSARTSQRRENMRRVLGLDRMDPATGLVNRFELLEHLVRLIARSQRLRYTSAVFVVEITNLEQLARDFGRSAASEVPVRVARRLLSTVRDIDTVARIADEKFSVLIEGPLTPSDATSLGPRMVARCRMPFPNKPEQWVPRVRVAHTLLPRGQEPAHEVLENLEKLLTSRPLDASKQGSSTSIDKEANGVFPALS